MTTQTSYWPKGIMAEYCNKATFESKFGKYTLTARPTSFWRRRLPRLSYNVGQIAELEVEIYSHRPQGIESAIELAYLKFVEQIPGYPTRHIPVDESRTRLDPKDKHRGWIYPLQSEQHRINDGLMQYWLTSPVNAKEDILLLRDYALFLHSSVNTWKITWAIILALITIVFGFIGQALFNVWFP